MKYALVILLALYSLAPDSADARPRSRSDANGTIIGGRPGGCPFRYCGCGLARFLGIPDSSLNLAAAWLRYPRTSPRPGAVAARRGHVMQLVEHVSGDRWVVRDYNSGRGLSRIHVRSIRGFATVQAPNYRGMIVSAEG